MMTGLRVLGSRLVGLFRKAQLDHELDEELRSHLEMLVQENLRKGMSPEEARYAGRRSFGGVDQAKEVYRDQRGLPMIETLVQDMRYGLRMLVKNPGFATVAVLTLALGIGANTAIFSLMNAVIYKLLPVQNPEQLLLVGASSPQGTEFTFSYPEYQRLQTSTQSFRGLAASAPVSLNVSAVDGSPQITTGQLVSGNYYSVLGVNAILGRTLTPEDDRIPAGHPVAMISYGYWKRRFGSDPDVIGKSIWIAGTAFTIVGVTPEKFFGLDIGRSPDVSVPLMMQPVVMTDTTSWLTGEGLGMTLRWVRIVGRLSAAASAQKALAETTAIYRTILSDYATILSAGGAGSRASNWLNRQLVLTPGSTGLTDLRRQFAKPIFVLMAIVGLILLIACANLANLMLAKAASRGREMAVRVALGAPRSRLMRQVLTETLLLTSLGGALGLLLAGLGSRLLVTWMSLGRAPIELDLRPDAQVLIFTGAVSLLTGLLLGFAPALRSSTVDLQSAMKQHTRVRGNPTSGQSLAFSRLLLIFQVAMSSVLLIGAGLFVRSFQNLSAVDLGFQRENILLMRLEPKGSDARRANLVRLMQIYGDVLDRVAAIPGVRSTSIAGFSPLHHSGFGGPISVPGYTPRSPEELKILGTAVYPNYFATVGLPLLAGRDFVQADMSMQAPHVAVINETMARHFFGTQHAIGRQFSFLGEFTIIGVVKDSKYRDLREPTPNLAYMTYTHMPTGRGQVTLHVRVAGNVLGMTERIRREVLAVDADMPAFEIQSVATEVDASMVQELLIARLSSFFGVLGLLLVSVGLYGLVAFAVSQRTKEIGLRMALGARAGNVIWIVMREVLLLTSCGLAFGLALAVAASQLASSMLFGLNPTDPATILMAMSLMLVVAVIAGYLPALRATRIDPMLALRDE